MHKAIKFLKRPRLVNPILIVAWPGMGEVALRAATYLVKRLKSEAFAYLDSANYFYPVASIIKKGIISIKELPQNYFYYWKSPDIKINAKESAGDLIIFLSSSQPDLSKAVDYVDSILEIARIYSVKSIISFAALPAPIDHLQKPDIWFAANDSKYVKILQSHNLKMMNEGEISGMNGLFLGLARKAGFAGYCLLGEIPIYTIQIENPRTVFAILEQLREILHLSLDLKELEDQANFIEQEINKLVDHLKEGIGSPGASGPGPISDAEMEKIKHFLTHLTRLPQSIKEKIEKLFELAKRDISKANELKQELDKWNVYKEYEDRFLDLFKRPRNKGN